MRAGHPPLRHEYGASLETKTGFYNYIMYKLFFSIYSSKFLHPFRLGPVKYEGSCKYEARDLRLGRDFSPSGRHDGEPTGKRGAVRMLQIYKRVQGELQETSDLREQNIWISLVAPTEDELRRVAYEAGLAEDLLRAPLDEEERPRLDYDEGQVLIIINVPRVQKADHGTADFDTIPLGILISQNVFCTICLEPTDITEDLRLLSRRVHTAKRTRFLLQILYRTATLYLRYLRQIDRRMDETERALQLSMQNRELIRLLGLQKSLVYFTTSLKSNQIVMEKLLRGHLRRDGATPSETALIALYPDDEDLLEDVLTENRQALEMADVYTSILTGTMDAFASVISNNLNVVMKFLTSVTIILALPTMVASFYGMNVPLPFASSPFAFGGIVLTSLALIGLAATYLARRGMF